VADPAEMADPWPQQKNRHGSEAVAQAKGGCLPRTTSGTSRQLPATSRGELQAIARQQTATPSRPLGIEFLFDFTRRRPRPGCSGLPCWGVRLTGEQFAVRVAAGPPDCFPHSRAVRAGEPTTPRAPVAFRSTGQGKDGGAARHGTFCRQRYIKAKQPAFRGGCVTSVSIV